MSRCVIVCSAMALIVGPLADGVPAQNPKAVNVATGERGELPLGKNGKPLNTDFETGTLADWTAEGQAFEQQPIKGPIDKNRPFGSDKRSDHTGEFWIGGYEKLRDEPQGTLTSKPFVVKHRWASFLLGGGSHNETRVELVRADTGKAFYKASGENQENMRPVVVDLKDHQGTEIFLRIVDQHTGGWGHVNFDDFRVYKDKPKFANAIIPVPPVQDLYPIAGQSGDDAAKKMELPRGFSVVCAAHEPEVQQPIAMALDDRGRVWIAEAYEYPRRAKEGQGRDRILIFEDTTGDGKLDKRTVFAENLNLVSGLEVGFGGVWVGAAPQFLFIPDRDGDDKPDGPPQVLLDGWGYQDTHETLNAFIWGPDGWLYGCHGVFTHSRVGKPDTPDKDRTPLNAGVWRYHPLRHEFDVFCNGTSNPWGVDFNDWGQAFCTACVIPHLYHVVQGARYQRQGGQHFNPHTYDDVKTIADHLHYTGNQWQGPDRLRSDQLGGGHAHAGAMVYLGGLWPRQYRNQLLFNNIHGNRINMDTLAPQGSSWVGSHGPDFILTRDQWSQVLNLRYGPDGQAWMIDWYDANQCHHGEVARHDRSNGRIYKINYGDTAPVKVDLKKLSDAALVQQLLNPNDWYVRHARRILQERAAADKLDKAAVHPALEKIALTHADETRRLRAMWALHVTGGLNEPLAHKLLADENPYVRGWAIQLLLEDRTKHPSPATLTKFAAMAQDDPSPVVRLYLASACDRLPLADRWEILSGLTSHAEDNSDHNLPLMYWYAMEPLAGADMRRALALALVAGENIPRLREFMVRRIGSENAARSLQMLVEGLGEAKQPGVQIAFLEGVQRALVGRRKVDPPAAWKDVYPGLLASQDGGVRSLARSLAVTFGDADAMAQMRRVLANGQAIERYRRQALDSLLAARDKQLPPLLRELLKDDTLRADALRALAQFDDAETPTAILAVYSTLPQDQRRDALATLCARTSFANALLSAVEKKAIPASDLSADLVRQLRNLGDAKLNDRIAQVWGTVRDSTEDKKALIARFKTMLSSQGERPADESLGRALFTKTCAQCHTLYGSGGKVGPDITGSNRPDLDYLLSNVLDPSSVMAKEYQPTLVVTADGRLVTGILRSETPAALTLQTANELVVVPKAEIDERKLGDKSMMPDDLLAALDEHQVRSLVAYLRGRAQVPILATKDNAESLFNGSDLSLWRGDETLWRVEGGEIVGQTTGLKRNEFLISELTAGDFRLTLDVKLVGNEGNSGIQFRSQPIDGGEMKGYQADVGAGWWGKLYEENGRALLWDKSGEKHVKSGEWNTYEVLAQGSKIQTRINGQLCVDLDDPEGARRGVFALQLHSGGPTEVRFRNLKLEVLDGEK